MKDKDRQREYHLHRVYGITLAQYNELLEKQGNACGVCKKHYTEFPLSLAVDHNHKTGEVRGLLCTYCNHRVVGRHQDYQLLENAAIYLRGPYTGWFVPEKKKRPRRRTKGDEERKKRGRKI